MWRRPLPKRTTTIDADQFVVEVNRYDSGEIECLRGRAFGKGMSCLCCMGGNCHVIGHVLEECVCRCLSRKEVTMEMKGRSEWILARAFKQEYVGIEREFHEKCRKTLPPSHSLGDSTKEDQDGAVEVMALKKKGKNRTFLDCGIPSGAVVRAGPEEEWFAVQEGFPTTRRVSRRLWDESFVIGQEQEIWIHRVGIQLGTDLLTAKEREQAMRLLWIWRDVFVEQLGELPVTDLVTHTIPTYPEARAHRAWDPVYAMDEVRWQREVLPEMIGKIVERGTSPWVAKTTWVSKKDTVVTENGRWPLRMVHTYCQLNDATLKTNYPMKRMEPILDELASPYYRYFFSADAAYGFYAVPIYSPHAYKTAFNTIL